MMLGVLKGYMQQGRTRSLARALQTWLPGIPVPDVDGSQRTLVFNTVRSNPRSFHLYTDFFLGNLLARCGSEVHLLFDDGVLKHWDSVQQHRVIAAQLNPMHVNYKRRWMQQNVAELQKIFGVEGLHVHWYSDFLRDVADEAVDEDVERYALASVLRYFEMGFFKSEDPDQQAYYRTCLENAKLSKALGRRVLENLQPDVYLTSHGLYSTWGPAYTLLRNAGTHTLVYGHHPYRPAGLMLEDAPGGALNHDALEQYLRTVELSVQQRQSAEDFLQSRFTHQASDTAEYFARGAQEIQLHANSSDAGYQYTFGLFPNVAWDAIGEHLNAIYVSVVDWIADTIRTIGRQGQHRLYVRFHPSESTRMKGTLLTESLVRECVPEIDDYTNVTLIPADDMTNSYQLIREVLDVTLVYSGTLGAEAQLLDTPVVACATGRFSPRFVSIAHAQDEYRAMLADPGALLEDFKNRRQEIIDSVMKYHTYISEELFFSVPILSARGRRVADLDELQNTAVDVRALERTLRRLLVKE